MVPDVATSKFWSDVMCLMRQYQAHTASKQASKQSNFPSSLHIMTQGSKQAHNTTENQCIYCTLEGRESGKGPRDNSNHLHLHHNHYYLVGLDGWFGEARESGCCSRKSAVVRWRWRGVEGEGGGESMEEGMRTRGGEGSMYSGGRCLNKYIS